MKTPEQEAREKARKIISAYKAENMGSQPITQQERTERFENWITEALLSTREAALEEAAVLSEGMDGVYHRHSVAKAIRALKGSK